RQARVALTVKGAKTRPTQQTLGLTLRSQIDALTQRILTGKERRRQLLRDDYDLRQTFLDVLRSEKSTRHEMHVDDFGEARAHLPRASHHEEIFVDTHERGERIVVDGGGLDLLDLLQEE